jgi:hypothetical protein
MKIYKSRLFIHLWYKNQWEEEKVILNSHDLRRTLEKQKEIKEFKEQRFELNSTIQQQKQKQHTEVIWKKHPVLLIIKSQLTRENENQSMSKNNKTCSRWMPVSLTIRWQRQAKGTCEFKITFSSSHWFLYQRCSYIVAVPFWWRKPEYPEKTTDLRK